MSSLINPEAAEPTSTQSFEQSDRNTTVAILGGTDADGGQIPAPASSESRVTPPGAAPSGDAGLVDYNTGDSADNVEDSAEQQG